MQFDSDPLRTYPSEIVSGLKKTVTGRACALYVTGGSVRDWLLGRVSRDLDCAVSSGAVAFAGDFAAETGGTLVLLDAQEGVARVVLSGFEIDFADFRQDTTCIEADLLRRDFTINSLAVRFDSERGGLALPFEIIDPSGGIRDCRLGCIRETQSGNLGDDPLRMLRAFRFQAELGFAIEIGTREEIERRHALIGNCAPERIGYELDRIFRSSRPSVVIKSMAAIGLLWDLIPELGKGLQVEQPASHHLDVFHHNLKSLEWAEKIIAEPVRFFPDNAREVAAYFSSGTKRRHIRWAALLHDVAKPGSFRIRDDRITFYNHDRAGMDVVGDIARRLRWSNEFCRKVTDLVGYHMWPFHLNNLYRKDELTPRACLRLVKAVGADLPGLFALALADSLAGQGPEKPADMEPSLRDMYREINVIFEQNIRPVLDKPRLVTGKDLIDMGYTPGPLFGEILESVEERQVTGEITSRQQALNLAEKLFSLRADAS